MALTEQRPTVDAPASTLAVDPPAGRDVAALSWPIRVALAACSAGAAAIHLAMVPTHGSQWTAEGVAFALVGWLQLAVAAAVVIRPIKVVVQVALVANLVFLGAWAWTRTAGPPFGPEAGVAHGASFVDLTCAALEAAVVVLAVVALVRPRAGAGIPRTAFVPLSIIPVGVLVLATAAIASPGAAGHAHGDTASGEAHSHAPGTPADHPHPEPTPAGAASAAAPATDGHGHGHSAPVNTGPFDDKGLALLANGEMAHEYGPDEPLDAQTRAVLVHQLGLTRLIAERFPTLGQARAAGSRPAGGFGPGMGVHMTTPTSGMPEVPPPDPSVPTLPGTLTDAEILRPANLLYAGSADDSPLAGFMYYSMKPEEPEGFAGPNDHWHTHGSLCIKMAGKIEVLHPAEKSATGCQAIDGMWVERTQWMVHVWTIPGYESNRGVFSDINPAIACPDGTYHTVSEAETERYKVNKCRANPE